MRRLILLFALVACAMSVSAQIKVESDGKVNLHGTLVGIGNDVNNELAVQVLGTGSMGVGGRMAFGDYSSVTRGGANVYIGEYGTTDTDIMQLHGREGIKFTRGNGTAASEIVAAYTYNRFDFYCPVWVEGLRVSSDKRLKSNIMPVSNSLDKLKKLEGVEYNFTSRFKPEISKATNEDNLTEKEKESLKQQKAQADEYEKMCKEKHLGLIAQNVQEVFPQLVEADSSGYLAVDYIGLIPVMIEAIKEQQKMIDKQNQIITALQNDVNTCCSTSKNKSLSIETTEVDTGIEQQITENGARLSQNTPNPFTSETEISYYVPENAQSASIYVFNMAGTLIKTYPINTNGIGIITIQGHQLTAGMYIYTLAVDGIEIDSKRMILTE